MGELDPISRWAQTVNWNAWEAIGTVGAVCFALWAADRAARDARRREVARIEVLATMAIGLRQIIEGNLAKLEAGMAPKELAEGLYRLKVYESAMVGIDAIDVGQLPTQRLVDIYMVVRGHAHMSAEYVREIASGGSEGAGLRQHMEWCVQSLGKQASAIVFERDLLKRPTLTRIREWARPRTGQPVTEAVEAPPAQ